MNEGYKPPEREPARSETLIRDHPFTGLAGERCSHVAEGGILCSQLADVHGDPRVRVATDPYDEPGAYGELVRKADVAQYAREPLPEKGIRVRLLNATPDPLGSIAALCKQYKGEVVRDLHEVTDAERRQYFDDLGKTVLNGPLEAAQFHFQIEGVTRSITHQMVRSRASFFAQESLRFAVPEGDWSKEIPLPPYLSRTKGDSVALGAEEHPVDYARNMWDEHMRNAARTYAGLIDCGMPAEEARGVLPHDMPTRIHWVCDLRTLLADAGKRTCTQAQFPWRVIFAGIAKALREHGNGRTVTIGDVTHHLGDGWQFHLIADKLRPYCYQSGSCGFMAQFDRGCSIRERVDLLGKSGLDLPSEQWSSREAINARMRSGEGAVPDFEAEPGMAIQDWEWAADPGAART